jgi:hypothetical protein
LRPVWKTLSDFGICECSDRITFCNRKKLRRRCSTKLCCCFQLNLPGLSRRVWANLTKTFRLRLHN